MSIFWSTVRWVAGALVFFGIGPLAAASVGALRTRSGSTAASLLISGSQSAGLGAAVVVLGVAAVVGLSGARFVSARFGFGVASLVLAWAAWRAGATPDIVRDAVLQGSSARGTLITLGVESALLMLCVAGIAWAMFRVGKPSDGFKPIPGVDPQPVTFRHAFAGSHLAPALGVAMVAGTVGLWIVGFEATKGQAVAAAVVAGLLAAMAAEFAASGMNRSLHPAPVLLALAALGLAAPLFVALSGGARLDEMIYAGRIPPLAVAAPLDLAAGAMLGVPLGLTWARSLMEKKVQEPASRPA